MGLTLLDTGVVIGLLDAGDAFHRASHEAIVGLMADDAFFCMATVSYAELLTGVGLGHHDRAIVEGFLDDFSVAIVPVDHAIAAEAARIRCTHTQKIRGGGRRPTVRMPDALILATAEVTAGIDSILVADAQWPAVKLSVDVTLLAAG
ncbi:PIN domain-containing protein [Baekduia sp.]|uniref:PIN domain-containing protein n=1 Tax=Baekduia sp. TaxID=2600305 RepID=UPI002E0A8397|nr:PIN domain-containing protein [Baekduia sp.]